MGILRTSSYMIPVKLEKEEGKYMLIHGYTGAIDIVSAELLHSIQANRKSQLTQSMIEQLLERGYLTTKTQEEEYEYVARIAKALHRKCDILYSTFTWVVTYNCNFRCPYCFEGRDKKDGRKQLVFTKEQVDIAYNAIERIQPSNKLRNNVITLYGGEPLLAKNREVVEYIVNEGKKRGYTFVAVTNGYEVDYFLDLLREDSIYKLQITVDGPKTMHNQRRIHYKDHNTFDKIVSNIKLALDRGIKVVVRMNSDNRNVDLFNELRSFFVEQGFYNYPRFELYNAILKNSDAVTSEEQKNLSFLSAESFTDKQDIYVNIRGRVSIYNNISEALKNKKPLSLKSISCAAQSNGYVLDPLGSIYPCWEVVGNNNCQEGAYSKDKITWNEKVLRQWKNLDVSQKIPCKYCKYALLCGGGCPYHYLLGENISCKLYRRSFNKEVNMAYASYKNNQCLTF